MVRHRTYRRAVERAEAAESRAASLSGMLGHAAQELVEARERTGALRVEYAELLDAARAWRELVTTPLGSRTEVRALAHIVDRLTLIELREALDGES